jgi:hypothetical protein
VFLQDVPNSDFDRMKGVTVGFNFETTCEAAGGGGSAKNIIEGGFIGWHFGRVDPFVVRVVEDDRWLVEDQLGQNHGEDSGGITRGSFHQKFDLGQIRVDAMVRGCMGVEGGGGNGKGRRHGRLLGVGLVLNTR